MAEDWLARLKKNREGRARLERERDELITAAAGARLPKTHIAEAVGLSAMQVHRILRATGH